ncbi:MAG: flagellin lysine-N-methylase [Selenomonadaceae bacterium]|nr:flagellin lysine-N-methylase [Selenomonadaceae bacterium]
MTKTFLHFRPEYVRDFVCDGSKCDAHCCGNNWNIFVDEGTHARYSQVKPKFDAEEILSHMNFNDERGEYLVTLDEHGCCPFLTDEKLCRLQLDYGESFLSKTCATYPRRTFDFGQFFERSLTLSCPVAAKMILFRDEPLKFEFVEVSQREHSLGGKIDIAPVCTTEGFAELMPEIQAAMISILQTRTLSIDGRLIVLGFFLDKLDEITSNVFDDNALTELIDAYMSKEFLSKHVPRMLASMNFDAEKFAELILELLVGLYGETFRDVDRKFFKPFLETLGIVPDEKNQVFVTKIADNCRRLADERKLFTARRANFMENFLVNELFLMCVPWKFQTVAAKNFGVFVAEYKLFEWLVFAAAREHFGEDFLLDLTVWFTRQTEHDDGFAQIIFDCVPDDIFTSLETLTDA